MDRLPALEGECQGKVNPAKADPGSDPDPAHTPEEATDFGNENTNRSAEDTHGVPEQDYPAGPESAGNTVGGLDSTSPKGNKDATAVSVQLTGKRGEQDKRLSVKCDEGSIGEQKASEAGSMEKKTCSRRSETCWKLEAEEERKAKIAFTRLFEDILFACSHASQAPWAASEHLLWLRRQAMVQAGFILCDEARSADSRAIGRLIAQTGSRAGMFGSRGGVVVKSRGGGNTSCSSSDEDDDQVEDDLWNESFLKDYENRRRSIKPVELPYTPISELPSHKKTHEETQELLNIIGQETFFSAIVQGQLSEHLVNCLKPVHLPANAVLFRQGDTGDGAYYLQEGRLTVDRLVNEKTSDLVHQKVVLPGASVGFEGVLHDTRRPVTVTALEDCRLWFLDRYSFKVLNEQAAINRERNFEEALVTIPVLNEFVNAKGGRLRDSLDLVFFKAGSVLVPAGLKQSLDKFYVIVDGKVRSEDCEDSKCFTYGAFLGTESFTPAAPSATTLVAATPVTAIEVNRKVFKKLFGEVHETIKKAQERVAS